MAGEIQTLAYPPAALFALCTAFVAYNIRQCIILSIETAQPKQPKKISAYYMAHEISSCYRGLDWFTENHDWEWATKLTHEELGKFLLTNAARVEYKSFAQRPPSKKL